MVSCAFVGDPGAPPVQRRSSSDGSRARGAAGPRAGAASALLALALLAPAASCSSPEPLGRPPGPIAAGGGGSDGGIDLGDGSGPPSADASGLCGNQIHAVITDAPNLYFVLDASGSMSAPAPGGGTRYSAVRAAAVDLVRTLGARINVGAAVFPRGATALEACPPGEQVFAVAPGDAFTGSDGPTTAGFKKSIHVTPNGGTPTAATLEALYPTLVALPGRSIVLLATDGGPNCNEAAACEAAECIANIEALEGCDPNNNKNCCAQGGPAGPGMCIDRQPTLDAIAALKAEGVKVYVIGIPGSEAYADVLDAMAIAGGTAQFGSSKYYSVTDLGDLGAVLGSIASVVIACDFTLSDPPPEPDLTNVYLDAELLPAGGANGWVWAEGGAVVRLLGQSCERLKLGQVKQVQIVSGCPTEAAK